MTADTALRLGQWLGTGPEVWMNLQKSYALCRAAAARGAAITRTIPRHQAADETGVPAP